MLARSSRPAPMTAEQAERIVDSLRLLTAAAEGLRQAVERLTEQGREVSEELVGISRDVRELGDRMARSGPGR